MDRDSEVAVALETHLDSKINRAEPLSGGDVAASYRVTLDSGDVVFAKTHTNPPAGFFETEARGLTWLREAMALPVPQVLAVSNEPPLLVLEWIDEVRRAPTDEAAFGRGLARVHRAGAACFGRDDRRTTGSRGLPNEPCDTWHEFYATQRIMPLVELAKEQAIYSPDDLCVIERVAQRLPEVGGPPELPARLHGDLWAGNRIVDAAGESWLIDPACHGGHREFDLAMMRLFGGFGRDAFSAYDEAFPLTDGWQERIELHQLAPVLVHAIKFRGSYIPAALTIARRYS